VKLARRDNVLSKRAGENRAFDDMDEIPTLDLK
jgi:5-keto 4-deoxyuronate isomerase